MSVHPDELTKLDHNLNYVHPEKVYDLRSQLSLKRRSDVSSSLNKRQFINDLVLNILSITSIFVVYYSSEEFYKEKSETRDGKPYITKKRNESDSTVTVLRCVNMILSFSIGKLYSVYFIIRHYYYDLKKMVVRRLISPEGKT